MQTLLPLDHLGLAREVAAHPDRWPVPVRFDPRGRWYQRLSADDRHEVWLLSWLPGQGTDLHDHGESAGAFVVVRGRLTERTVVPAVGDGRPLSDVDSTVAGRRARLATRDHAAGTGRRFGRGHIHEITNLADEPAVSVHVYGPVLRTMNRYRLDGVRLSRTAVDRAGSAW
jgi:hypothetical protein